MAPADATDKTVTATSSKESVATVSASGATLTVRGVAEGTCDVTVSAGGKSAKCAVTVTAASGE